MRSGQNSYSAARGIHSIAIRIQIRICIRIAILVRRALTEVRTLPVLLITNYFIAQFDYSFVIVVKIVLVLVDDLTMVFMGVRDSDIVVYTCFLFITVARDRFSHSEDCYVLVVSLWPPYVIG